MQQQQIWLVCALVGYFVLAKAASTALVQPQLGRLGSSPAVTAISHQSFTRLHSADEAVQVSASASATSQPRSLSAPLTAAANVKHTVRTDIPHGTPIISPLTHTPAHLTYSAIPIVYQMLPQPQPVHSIPYDTVKASPLAYRLIHQ